MLLLATVPVLLPQFYLSCAGARAGRITLFPTYLVGFNNTSSQVGTA